jgi:hypothetical protein
MSAHGRHTRDAPGVRGGQAAAKSRSRHDAAETATSQKPGEAPSEVAVRGRPIAPEGGVKSA